MTTARGIVETLKTFGLVTLVSALVWLWAESESLRSAQLSPKLEAFSEQPLVEVKLDGLESGGIVRIALRGSTSGIDLIQRAMPGSLKIIPGFAGIPAEPGEHTLVLRDVLSQQTVFRTAGVTIESVEPAQVRVRIVAMQELRVPVIIDAPSVEFEIPPTATPREVTLRIPLAVKLSDQYAAIATIDEAILTEAREGERFRTSIKLVLPGLSDRRPDPQTVGIELTLRRRLERHNESSVPILVALPPDEADRWKVQLKESSLNDVAVLGPSELVMRLKDRKFQLQAMLVLTADDLKNKITSKSIIFEGAPAGLIFSEKEPIVQFTITPRGTQ